MTSRGAGDRDDAFDMVFKRWLWGERLHDQSVSAASGCFSFYTLLFLLWERMARDGKTDIGWDQGVSTRITKATCCAVYCCIIRNNPR